jgi:elongation factor P
VNTNASHPASSQHRFDKKFSKKKYRCDVRGKEKRAQNAKTEITPFFETRILLLIIIILEWLLSSAKLIIAIICRRLFHYKMNSPMYYFRRIKLVRNIPIRTVVTEKAWNCVKIGNTILLNDIPYLVIKALQGGRGRGASFVKSTIKNRFTGKTMDKTFNSEDPLEIPEIHTANLEYSWDDESSKEFVFMDTKTFEEIRVPHHVVSKPKFLVAGQNFGIVKYKDQIVDLTFPHIAEFTLVSIDESVQMYV